MGIEKSKARARACVCWPAMYSDIEAEVKQCTVCNTYSNTNQREPLLPHSIPVHPWEKVGVDFFSLDGKDFLLIVDYYSKYPEVIQMNSKTAQATIVKLNTIFARFGIPQTVIADNMPFHSKEFKSFADSWNFQIVTSSPAYPRSNGLVERNVQTVKRLFKKAQDEGKDIEMAILEFRNTPITGLDESPAQLLMSRHLRSHLPRLPAMLKPCIVEGVREKLGLRQQVQKSQYDKRTKPLSELKPGDTVRYQVNRSWKPATVVSKHDSPRSYNIRTHQGTILRRNRYHLKQSKETINSHEDSYFFDDDYGTSNSPDVQQPVPPPQPISSQSGERRSRYGRVIRPPIKYQND